MKLIIVRHGRTIQNEQDIVQGQGRGDLSEEGYAQIAKLAERLKDEKIDIAYSSDLDRALKTAEGILKYHPKVELIQTKAIREISYGTLEGTSESLRAAIMDLEHAKDAHYKISGGESLHEVQTRVVNWFYKLLEKHSDKTILIVSHGTAIAALMLHLNNKTHVGYKKLIPDNTGVTIIKIGKYGLHKIHLLNCTKHLD